MTQELINPVRPKASAIEPARDGSPAAGNLVRDPEAITRIPDNPRWGYRRSRYMLRTALIALAVTVMGLALILWGGSRYTTAAGISLLVPGGGFLYDGWPILFVLTWALFWLSWNFWVGFGAGVHVYAVYLLSVAGGIALADGPRLGLESGTTWPWAVPVLLFGAALYVAQHLWNAVRGGKRERVVRDERQASLSAVDSAVIDQIVESFNPPEARPAMRGFDPVAVTSGPDGLQPPLPVTDGDAALAKYLLQISMQPISEFKGWDWGKDAVEPSALRYQVTEMGCTLATLQANYLPAFPSVVEEAQRNIVAKAQEVPVWGYWYFENFFGNLTRKPDPIGQAGAQNIMFTGFLAKHLAHFEAATGDFRYDQPGALKFTWDDGRTFEYSFSDLAVHSSESFANAPLGLWPCEPGQVYPICNAMGAAGVQGYGAIHGTEEWSRVEDHFNTSLEVEWSKLNGDLYGHFNERLGLNVGSLTWNDGTSPMFMDSNGFMYAFGRTLSPEIASRMYLLAKNPETFDKLPIADGELRLPEIDAGNPGPLQRFLVKFPNGKHFLSGAWVDMETTGFAASNVIMYAGIADLARQFGRDDIADAAVRGIDWAYLREPMADGRPYPTTLATHAMVGKARWGRHYKQDDFLTARVPRYNGPLLTSAPYPEVLVTYANGRDGQLCLTLEPTSRPGRFPLTFERLRPDTTYTVRGADAEFRTDSQGSGTVDITLSRRVTVLIEPLSETKLVDA